MSTLITGAGRPLSSQDISEGVTPNLEPLHKFGHNTLVGTTEEDMTDIGGLYVYPSAATAMTVSSTDVNDTLVGSGAQTILIEGLDDNYLEVSHLLNLDGQSGVSIPTPLIRFHRAIVKSGDQNIGIIHIGTGTITGGVPATQYGCITANDGRSQHGLFTISAIKKGYLKRWKVSSSSQKDTDAHLYIRPFGEVFQVHGGIHFFDSPFPVTYEDALEISPKSDIAIRASVASGTASMECFWGMRLKDV